MKENINKDVPVDALTYEARVSSYAYEAASEARNARTSAAKDYEDMLADSNESLKSLLELKEKNRAAKAALADALEVRDQAICAHNNAYDDSISAYDAYIATSKAHDIISDSVNASCQRHNTACNTYDVAYNAAHQAVIISGVS